jgi:hypothetical protein
MQKYRFTLVLADDELNYESDEEAIEDAKGWGEELAESEKCTLQSFAVEKEVEGTWISVETE